MRIDMPRLLLHALAQRGLGAFEIAERDQAARMRVVHGRGFVSGGERLACCAFGVGRAVRGVQRNRERVRRGGISRHRRQQPRVCVHRFISTIERGQRGDVLRDEFGIGRSRYAEWCDDSERVGGSALIVAKTCEHERRARIAFGGAAQQRFGFFDTAETEQQFAERGQCGCPVRIERERAAQ